MMKALVLGTALIVASCNQVDHRTVLSSALPEASAPEASNDFAACQRGILPDYSCTPGATMTVDLSIVCHTSTDTRRHVSRNLRVAVYREYGVSYPQGAGMYEVDHLIPLELGGSNDINNLWLEAAEPRPGFHEKDAYENYLHAQVCSGKMILADAQHAIATNWLEGYERIKE